MLNSYSRSKFYIYSLVVIQVSLWMIIRNPVGSNRVLRVKVDNSQIFFFYCEQSREISFVELINFKFEIVKYRFYSELQLALFLWQKCVNINRNFLLLFISTLKPVILFLLSCLLTLLLSNNRKPDVIVEQKMQALILIGYKKINVLRMLII